MSGVYIKGLEMPESCLDCKVHYVWGSGRPQCLITGEFIDDRNAYKQKRLEDCPLVPVPDHGRLIDLDAYYDRIEQKSIADGDTPEETEVCLSVIRLFNEQICPIPTIIPADKEAEA